MAQGRGRLGMALRHTRAVLGGQRSALGTEEGDERQSKVGRELGGCRVRGGVQGLGVVATRDKGAAHTWRRRRLHGLCVKRRWRAVDRTDARWRAVIEPPWCHRVCVGSRWPGHAALGRHGPLASGPCRFSEFFKIFKHPHFDIRIGDLPDVQTLLNFAGRQIGTQGATSLFVSSSKS
jgi:hypothetical protein